MGIVVAGGLFPFIFCSVCCGCNARACACRGRGPLSTRPLPRLGCAAAHRAGMGVSGGGGCGWAPGIKLRLLFVWVVWRCAWLKKEPQTTATATTAAKTEEKEEKFHERNKNRWPKMGEISGSACFSYSFVVRKAFLMPPSGLRGRGIIAAKLPS